MSSRRFIDVARLIDTGLAWLFIGAVLLNFANVVGRYLFGQSIFGADEIQVFALVVITYLGAIVVSLRDDHLRMDVVVQMFPKAARYWVRVLETLLLCLICGYVAWYSWLYTNRMRTLDRLSDMAELPVWYFHASVTLAFAAMSIIGLCRFLLALRSGRASVAGPAPVAKETP